MIQAFLTLLLLLWPNANAYKIAVFAPEAANSQVIFNARVAEVLADAGHSVTLFLLRFSHIENPPVSVKPSVTQQLVEAITDIDYAVNISVIQKEILFANSSFFNPSMLKMLPLVTSVFTEGCEKLLQNKKFLSDLRASHFDVAFAPPIDLCVAGIVHHVGIPAWIWLSSGALLDNIAAIVGVPSPPSYVPSVMHTATDELTFFQRVASFLTWTIQPIMYSRGFLAPETALFRKYIDPNFPDLVEIGRNCPLVMINSNELYDLARPMLHKIIYIGGIGMNSEKAQPLQGRFKELVENHDRLVLMSFGSVANASLMPADWKAAFLGAFRRFPEYQFLLRYDINDLDAKLPANVHTFKWLPQRDLMQNEKVKALISHGGYNSVQETINAGKPLVAIPLLGDQPRNALIAEKLGIGVSIQKAELNEEKLVRALNDVLKQSRFKEAAQQIHRMVRLKPVSPDQLVVKWTEFVTEFKQLPNLTPQAIHLNFVQYFCLDVIACLFAIVSMVLYTVYRIFRFILGRLKQKLWSRSNEKQKKS